MVENGAAVAGALIRPPMRRKAVQLAGLFARVPLHLMGDAATQTLAANLAAVSGSCQ